MKFATFPSAAALAVALLAVSAHAGFPDEEANSHFIRRLPAGGNGRGQGNRNGGGGNGTGAGKPGVDDEIDVIVKWKNTSVSTAQLFWSISACMRLSSSW